jgi:phospholipase C
MQEPPFFRPPDVTRREFLRTGAALGASALAYESLGGHMLASADARARGCGAQLGDIEHIVVLMQENRSFDEFFGTFPGVRGFDDHRNRQAFAQPGYHGPGSHNGHLPPYHMDGRKPVGQCVSDPNHDWTPQHLSWNHGHNDRFYAVHSRPEWDGAAGANVMGYFTEGDLPYFWALARAYTLCDMYFSSVIGPTEPNRLYSVSATLDPAGRNGGPSVETVFDAQGLVGDFRWTTMPEQLQARGITWKSYTAANGQFDSPFPAFRRFRTPGTLNRLGIQPVYPDDFEHDLDRDELPAVSWVQATFGDSEHAPFPPAKGEFLTVDRLPAHAGGIRGPIGLGFRVPCIVVSPWSRGGFVCSDTFDHTSVLRLIERRFGAEVPNLSRWRRSVTGDLTSAFNFAATPDYSIPKLPQTSATSPLVTTAQCAPLATLPPYPVPSSIPVVRQLPGRARRPSGPCKPRPRTPPVVGLG